MNRRLYSSRENRKTNAVSFSPACFPSNRRAKNARDLKHFLLLLLFSFLFLQISQAQCDILYDDDTNINLSLDEFGSAVINPVLFESEVNSSFNDCHPDNGGTLNLYQDAGKTMPFPTTFYNCTNIDDEIDVYVALMNSNGNESAAIFFEVTITDAFAPIMTCPAAVTQTLPTDECDDEVSGLAATASDNCNGMTVSYEISGATTVGMTAGDDASGTTFNAGVSVVTYTATDAEGNENDCSVTVTLGFPQPYVIDNCPSNSTVNPSGPNCEAVVNFTTPDAVNDCPVVFTPAPGNTASGDALAPGAYTNTFTFDNGADNVVCTFTITVADSEMPMMITADQSVTTSGCFADYNYDATSDLSDNCTDVADLEVSYTLSGNGEIRTGMTANISENALPTGDYTVAFTIEDEEGNILNHSYTLTVLENMPPVAVAQDITVGLSLEGEVTVTAVEIDNGSNDNCAVVTYEIALDDGTPDFGESVTFACADIGMNDVLLRVKDANDNTSSPAAAVVTVEDNQPPVALCEDITVTLMSGAAQVVNAEDLDAGSEENCFAISDYEINVDTNGDGTFNTGYTDDYTVMCPVPDAGFLSAKMRVTADAGSTAECQAKIFVADDTPPVAVAMDITLFLDSDGELTVNAADFDNGSTEDCGGLEYTFALSENGTFTETKDFDCTNAGALQEEDEIYFRVTNGSGASDTVGPLTLRIEDNMLPTASCVAALTVDYDAAGNIVIPAADLNDGSADNCPGFTFTIAGAGAGTFAASYTSNCDITEDLILRVTDASGNSDECTLDDADITVEDNVPPTAACNSFNVALITTSVVVYDYQVNAASADACNGLVDIDDIEIARVINGVVGTYGDDVTFGCADAGMQNVRLRATDDVGLMSVCNAVITIQETQPPVFTSVPPSPSFVECDQYTTDGPIPADAMVMTEDNCGASEVTISDSGSLGSCNTGTITRTYTATDAGGNTSTAQIIVIVQDTTSPAFTRPADVDAACSGGGVNSFDEENTGEPTDETDNCDPLAQDGLAREAVSETYHGFFDFVDHDPVGAANYDFSVGAWTNSNPALINTSGAPSLIKLTSPNGGAAAQADFTIMSPADGYFSFDYSVSSADSDAADDPFGYVIDGTFTALPPSTSAERVTVALLAGQMFGFSQRTLTGTDGAAVTTVRSFTFADENISPQPVDCPNNYRVARVWSMTDCLLNEAPDQLQRIIINDDTAPEFTYTVSATIDAAENTCAAFVDLDMGVTGRLIEDCDLVSVSNDADVLYGEGNGEEDASGFYAPGTYTVTFEAEDGCNSTTFPVTFTVEDNTNPTLICHDVVNVTIDNSGSAILTADAVIASASDNCGIAAGMSAVTPNTFTTDDFGQNPITVSVQDAAGNTTTCNSVANVIGSVEYDADEVSGPSGAMISLPVYTRNFTDINSFAVSVNVADTTVAKVTGVTGFNSALTGTGDFAVMNDGLINVSYFDASADLPDLDEVVLFTVEIQIQPLASTGDFTGITLTNAMSFRDDAAGNPQSVPTLTEGGSVEVSAASSLRSLGGTMRTIATDEVMENVTINLSGTVGNSTSTGTDGTFAFDVPFGSDQTVSPYKNINWNNGGNVNILDVLTLHQLSLVGSDAYTTPWQPIAADTDGSGDVNILDVLLAHRVSLGIITDVPSNLSWRFIPSDVAVPPAPLTTGFPNERTYDNITSDITDADFNGIKTCDVAGPFATGSGLVNWDGEERDNETLYFRTEDFELTAGESYAVQIKTQDFTHISAYQFNLLFDTEYLTLNEAVPGTVENISLDNFNTLESAMTGLIRTDWYHLHPVVTDDETVMFTLNFTATQGGMNLSEVLTLTAENGLAFYADGDGEIGDTELQFGGTTAVTPVAQNGFELLQNKPNPASAETVIPYRLPQSGAVTLTIVDMAGREVFRATDTGQSGYNEWRINITELPSSGVFRYRLDSEAGTAVRKMVILR